MSLRTGFCCRNVLAQDKIKMHRKLYLSLPHIGILGVPSPNCMLHLQFWDGALLPPAVLGWHFLTCKFFYSFSPANFSPAVLGWRLLTCSFFPADFSHAVLGWHRPGLPNSPQKKINGIMAALPQRLFFFRLMAAWLNEVVVRAVALLSALTKEYNMHIIQC